MSKKRAKGTKSKRQIMREERRKKERQQRLITIGVIVAVALVLVGLIAAPAAQEANTPVGEFVRITPISPTSADGTAVGDPESKVVIQIFEDFRCTACTYYSQNIEPQVIEEIAEKGKAYYVFHQYPFMDDSSPYHDSDNAALAAECAAEQNRFWEYKEMLFANLNHIDGEFSDVRLAAFADTLGLDTDQFEACYKEQRYRDKITEDMSLAQEMGVVGTPSIFVNGQNVSPGKVPTFDQINALVDKFLAEGGG